MISTPGRFVAQEMPVMVFTVALPAPSFNVPVRSPGELLGQAMLTQASVLTAVTGAKPVSGSGEEVPIATDRLFAAAPSVAGNATASADVVCAHTLNAPFTSCEGPMKLLAAGDEIVNTGAVESTLKAVGAE